MDKNLKTLPAQSTVAHLADLIARHDPVISNHQAWPLVDEAGRLVGMITRSDVLRAIERSGGRRNTLIEAGSSPAVVTYPDETVAEAVNRMLAKGVGRLPVVDRADPCKLVGFVGRTSLLSTRLRSLHQETVREDGWLRRAQRKPA